MVSALLVASACLGWLTSGKLSAAEPTPTPGQTLELTFPDLPKDLNGNAAACHVRIPEIYDPQKPVPFLLWLDGGNGTNDPEAATALVDKTKFVMAAFPYPSTTPDPVHALVADRMGEIWAYHKPMLAEVLRRVPNLDPKIRVVAGVSNGAHCIGTYLSQGISEFTDCFHIYVLAEGGSRYPTARIPLKGKQIYLAWGSEPGSSASFMKGTYLCALKAQMQLTLHEMKGVAHGFPDNERAAVKQWLEVVAIPKAWQTPEGVR